ncbi:alpha/beta-hydrolase [Cytidiella melzeri]|nr:alpha/beta-hydrolase [Cytidiella melzeri]
MSFSNLQRISIHYDEAVVQNMIAMIKHAPFPSRAPIDAKEPWTLGIDYDYLRELKHKFETDWQWARLESEINRFDNHLVEYSTSEGDQLELHFIHQRSNRADAIPLILLHGWPGLFADFRKVIEPLVNPSSPEVPAFHVVVPSLPGFFKSTLPRREGWNLFDIAKLFNSLMTDLLGYKEYAGQGGDWGSMIARIMSNKYPESLTAVHFNMFIATPSGNLSELSESQLRLLQRSKHIGETGAGYRNIQKTKPFTIGIAIASSPLAILTYIGEKFHDWSDPARVDPQDTIDIAALYFLSGSFATSVVIYSQTPKDAHKIYDTIDLLNLQVKSKAFGFSAFPYEISVGLKDSIAPFGNLTFYKEHQGGGHFPALDSPNELIGDLREFFGKKLD